MKAQDRLFEALNYGKGEKARLTVKQYLVYSYLMSISKWNGQGKEQHYYVYKNSFLIKDACTQLKISQPTWRSAIKKLIETFYIQEYDKYFIIEIPNTYAPLDIRLIRFLLSFGAAIKNGGNIISVYSIIYNYWKTLHLENETCEITINQLRKLFNSKHDTSALQTYKLMLSLFETYNLIDIKRVGRQFNGNPYTGYVILNVRLNLPDDIDLDENAPDNIKDILRTLNLEDN